MTIYTQTPIASPGRLSEHLAPQGDVLGADIMSSWLAAPISSIARSGELTIAEQGQPNLPTRLVGAAAGAAFPLATAYLAAGAPGLPAAFRNEPDSPIVDVETARAKISEAGVDLQIPETGIRSRALDILIDRKKRENQRQSTQARSPDGLGFGALRLGASLGTQMADPLNVASAFIPVFGPARYAAAVGKAGGAFGRAATRARFGAVEGAVGATAVEPLIYGAATQEQADYGFADSLLNIGLGTVLGGGLHVGAGVAVDAVKRGKSWKTQRAADVNPTAPLPRVLDAMSHPEREQLLRTSTAQALTGREINPLVTYEPGGLRLDEEMAGGGTTVHEPTVKVDEVTGVEGITLYHGSPHTFERFSMEKIGTGEGVQAQGHGLYFAQNKAVARGYRESTIGFRSNVATKALEDAGDVDTAIAATQAELTRLRGQEAAEWRDRRIGDAEVKLAELNVIKNTGAPSQGSLYEVRLNAKPEDFLDWDRPLSEQLEPVQEKLRAAMGERKWEKFKNANTSTAMRQGFIAFSDESVAKKLRDAGIPGVRYLDQGSRTAGDGSSNYVIFDDSLVTTVRRNEENLLRRPEDIRTAVNASFAPEASRLYDADGVRAADEKIKAAPADDVFPEQSLGEAMEDVTALVASLDELTGGNLADMVSREMEPFDEVQMTAEAYGRAVQEAASCGLRRGTV